MSKLEELFSFHLKTAGLAPVAEYRFAAEIVGTEAGVRKRLIEAKLKDWRFDFAFVDLKVAIEYNSAYLHGWTVLRFDGRMVRTLEAIDTTKAFLARVKAND
jgi:hypothetical protein